MSDVSAMLEVADKVGSVVGATTGVLSLLVALRGTDGSARRTKRHGTGLAVVLLLVSAAFAVRFVPAVPGSVATAARWALPFLGVIAVVMAFRSRRSGPGRVRESWAPGLSDLLTALQEDIGHRYRFSGFHAPPLSRVYVRRRASIARIGARQNMLIGINDLLGRRAHAVLLGGAGSGKSTLAATAVREVAGIVRDGRGKVVAVTCLASDLAGHQLPDAIARACARDYGLSVPSDLFKEVPMAGGRWQVFIDGVDEVVDADARSRTLWRLHDLLSGRADRYQVVVTSRPLPPEELADLRVTGVEECELRPFDRADLTEFAVRWFSARPVEGSAPEQRAAMFLARVAGARLGPVARVPLLATIAAMVYEHAEDRALPTSRAELYEQFVDCMLEGRGDRGAAVRGFVSALGARGTAGAAVAAWFEADFHTRVLELLGAVATVQLDEPGADLVGVAVDWLDRTGPRPLSGVLPEARRTVDGLLRATALLVPRQGGLAFVHQSFVEFLVTRDGEAPVDLRAWLSLAINPGTRSRAGFAAARQDDADRLVAALLNETGGVVAAGDMIADGVPIGDQLRGRVLDCLIRDLTADGPGSAECLRVLRELSVDGEIFGRLVGVVDDTEASSWIRAVVADALADVDLPAGVRAMRHLRRSAPREVAEWIVTALQTRGIVVGDNEREEIAATRPRGGRSLGRIGRQALAEQAANPEVAELQRLSAAIRLCADGDQAPLRAFLDESGTDSFVRLRAAVVLADHGDDQPLREMAAGHDPQLQVPVCDFGPFLAARNLARRDPGSGAVIRTLISRSGMVPSTVAEAALLADLGDPGELERLTYQPVSEANWRQSPSVPVLLGLAAARELCRRGVPESLHRALAGGPRPAPRAFLLAGLVRLGDRQAAEDLTKVLRSHRLPARLRTELHGAVAARRNGGSLRRLRRRSRPPFSGEQRLAAAARLVVVGDPAGPRALRAMAGSRWQPAGVRVRAAEAASRDAGEARAALSAITGSARVRLAAATRLARRFGDERALDRLLGDTSIPVRHRRFVIEFLTDGLNPAWPGTEQKLFEHGDWRRETVGGVNPFSPGFPFSIQPRQTARRVEMLRGITNDRNAPSLLRLTAAASFLPDPAAVEALSRLSRDRGVRPGMRRRALVTLAQWVPQAAEPLVREAVRDRWLPRITTWRLLYRILIEPDYPVLAPVGWAGFTDVDRLREDLGEELTLAGLVRAAGRMLFRPRLDTEAAGTTATRVP